jgi:hypothetical protein
MATVKKKYIVKERNRRVQRQKNCFLNFLGLLGSLSAVLCICKFCVYVSASCWREDGRGGGKIVFFRNL